MIFLERATGRFDCQSAELPNHILELRRGRVRKERRYIFILVLERIRMNE